MIWNPSLAGRRSSTTASRPREIATTPGARLRHQHKTGRLTARFHSSVTRRRLNSLRQSTLRWLSVTSPPIGSHRRVDPPIAATGYLDEGLAELPNSPHWQRRERLKSDHFQQPSLTAPSAPCPRPRECASTDVLSAAGAGPTVFRELTAPEVAAVSGGPQIINDGPLPPPPFVAGPFGPTE